MEFKQDAVRAYRYWIQGYAKFYEPIVHEYFCVVGYRVLAHPAQVGKADIQRVLNDLFDGRKRLGPELDEKTIRHDLQSRTRLQPDFLLERDGKRYLAELKSWGGYRTGVFDLATLEADFLRKADTSAFMLVDSLAGQPIHSKLLVVSARSAEHERVLGTLRSAYQTQVELLYLDEVFATPQLAGAIERQLRFLDAAVAELKQALQIGR
jgi:hypothetical protein